MLVLINLGDDLEKRKQRQVSKLRVLFRVLNRRKTVTRVLLLLLLGEVFLVLELPHEHERIADVDVGLASEFIHLAVGNLSDLVDKSHDAGLEDLGAGGEIPDVTEAKDSIDAFTFHYWI